MVDRFERKKLLVTFFSISIIFFALINVTPALCTPLAENTWSSKASMPQSNFGLRAATVTGKIYVIGGSINYEYNPANDSWTTKTAMPTPRNWFSIAVNQDKIYTFGGGCAWGLCNSTEVYNPVTDAWVSLESMPFNASAIDANVVNGKIYIIGLPDSRSSFSVNLAYDVATNTWTNRTTMPYPANAYLSAVVDQKIYIFGGFDFVLNTTRAYNQTRIYDPQTDSWTLGSPIPGPFQGAVADATTGANAPKRIYVFGGKMNGIDGVSTTQVYNPENDSWSFGSLMPTARTGLTVSVVDDQFYVFGGSSYAVFTPALKVNEQYTPFGYGNPEKPNPPSNSPSESPTSEIYLTAAILVVIIVTLGASLLLYLRKRKAQAIT
jgi:N-acetylneuraminic acid mutarotase